MGFFPDATHSTRDAERFVIVGGVAVSQQKWQHYVALARELGFAEMAAAPIAPVRYAQAVNDWVQKGYHASMEWYARGVEKRLNPQLVMEDAKSILVLLTPYEKEPVHIAGKKVARYAAGDDYHDVLLKKLKQIKAAIYDDYPEANIRPYVDTGPVLERYWAEQSGLGWIGKNGNLIHRELGSYVFLASMVTNLVPPEWGSPHEDFCGRCRACIDACPTDAIVADRVVDSNQCISFLNIEQRGEFPEDTPEFSDWLFGCDICQEVCPWTEKFSSGAWLEAFRKRPGYSELEGQDFLEMEQETFSMIFRKSPIKRTKLAGIKRNLQHLLKPSAD
jgi:epoxyqueuosine reductase